MLMLIIALACATGSPDSSPASPVRSAADYPWAYPGDGIPPLSSTDTIEWPGGLVQTVIEPGDGPIPREGAMVAIHFNGWLAESGKLIDSSAISGKPVQFLLGQGRVLQGWDQGISKMRVGERSRFQVPSELAFKKYGSPDGTVPPHADIVYDIWLVAAAD
ncbi:MAG: FKBP-type peptidyl-prolyl cis-trans isomerase [Alphaproteobacteria bacterium]|nr:FKBP-type peptidyl-prolyl cis-trans isomerase [Alphaproteobacteria bacterium]